MNNFTQSFTNSKGNVTFNKFLSTVGLLLTLLLGNASFGQINITAGGTAVTQNFNAIVGSPGTLPTEWTAQASTSVRTIPNFNASGTSTIGQVGGNSMSSSATAGIYRYNANGVATESAIGGLSSSSANKTVTLYTRLKNNAATAIGNFTISYNVEKYRNGSNAAGFSIELFYSTNGTSWTSCGTDFTTNFTADADNAGFATSPGSTVSITSKTYSPSATIAQNGVVYFAWRYSVTSGTTTSNAQALGVDDISITANASTSAPTVTSDVVISITSNSAISGGNVTADGGTSVTARGVAFGTTTNPTTGTSDGTGTGTFTSSLTGLSPNTQYYFRAYATNSVNTSYGSESNFYTLANVPGVLTVGNPQTTTLDVTVNATTQNSNPAATEYAIHETSTGLFVQANGSLGASAVWQTAATWATITVAGLTQNTTYTFETKARNNDVAPVETSYGATTNGTTLANLTPGWCNLQWPYTQTMNEGSTFDVYSRVFASGITNNPGQGLGLNAWIGYSTTNGTPDNTWTWVPATFFNDDGANNDEYKTVIGAGMIPGTYYYVSRFQIGSGSYVYGGKNGNFWGSTADSGVLTINSNLVDWCNIQTPTSGAIVEGGTYNVYAQVYEPGATTNSGQAAGITAWIGYSTTNNDPSSAGWNWVTTTFNGETGTSNNNDEYVANIAAGLTPNTYYYASRFQKSGSTEYVYGGTNGTPWTTSGVLTVTQAVPVVTAGSPSGTYGAAFTYNIIATSSPTSYAVSSGTLPTGLSLNTTTGEISGTPTAAGSFSVDVTATNSGGTSAPATLSFTIAQANQTITFGALSAVTTATAPFALTGTASSGLTVTYASSNTAVATVSGNTITIVGAGTTTITASQSGDSNYNAATDVLQTLVVTYPVIAGWDFTGVGSTTIASLAATTFNTNLDNSSTLSNVTRGSGAGWSTAGNSFRTAGFKNEGIATTNTDYFQTTLKTDLGYSLNLSNIGANLAGTASFAATPGVSSQFAYSLDGTTFTLIGSPTVTIGTPTSLAIDLSGVSALQNLPSGTTVTFRYYASGQTTTGGWGFNSATSGTNGLTFNGTIVCVDPVAYNVTGGGSLCAGATGVAVGLSNSQKGISYQLKRDGTNVGSLVAGTGAALAFGNQTIAGTYTVEATNVACILNLTMTGNAIVIVNPIPTLATVTATPACDNTPSSVTMTGLLPSTAGTFYYTNSMTGPVQYPVSGTSDASGNFTFSTPNLPLAANGAIITIVSGTATATGCTTTFSGKTVAVVVNPIVAASVSTSVLPTGTICSGASVTFTATPTNGGATPTYQWKINGTDVSGEIASTFTTATLANNDVVTVEMTSNAPCASGSPATSTGITIAVNANEWTGGTGNWNVAGNWSCGTIPSIETQVIINSGVVTIPADAQAKSLTLTGTSTLLVATGNDLTVAGALDVASTASVTIENNANLLQNGTSNTNIGTTVNVKRSSSALYRLDYTLWSSPTSGTQTLANFSPVTSAGRFYTYNEGTNAYVSNTGSATFATGKGYLVRMPNTWVAASTGTPASWTGTFTGKPNNGDLTYTMDLTTDGYNAVGNPYPSAINIDEFFNDNANIDGTLWLWRKTNDANNTVSYTTCSGAGIASGGNAHPYTDDSILSVGQGFIVKANNANDKTLYFNNTMRSTSNVNQFFRTNAVRDRYWLELKNQANVSFGTKLIAHMETGTTNYDSRLDGLFMNDRQTALLSVVDGKELVIQARPTFNVEDVIPLLFKTNAAGTYSVSLSQFEGIFNNGQDILLRDNQTGTVHNLSASGAYSFSTEVGSFASRFEILYQNALSTVSFNENSVVVYNNNHNIYINSGRVAMDKVKVFDVRGRLIIEKAKINASEIVIDGSRIANQVLLLQITSAEGTVVTKKIVN